MTSWVMEEISMGGRTNPEFPMRFQYHDHAQVPAFHPVGALIDFADDDAYGLVVHIAEMAQLRPRTEE